MYSLCTRPTAAVRCPTLRNRTAGVRKYSLRQSAPLGMVYCHARFQNRTPIVRGATGPPSLCTQTVAIVRPRTSGNYTDPHSGSMKMLFSSELVLLLGGVLPIAFLNRTTTVRGTMVPPSLCKQPVAPVWRRMLGSSTDPYSGCTRNPFALECSPWDYVLPCAFSESYTYSVYEAPQTLAVSLHNLGTRMST